MGEIRRACIVPREGGFGLYYDSCDGRPCAKISSKDYRAIAFVHYDNASPHTEITEIEFSIGQYGHDVFVAPHSERGRKGFAVFEDLRNLESSNACDETGIGMKI